LDRCYELDRGRPFHKHRLLAIALTLIVLALLLLVTCLLPVGTAVREILVRNGWVAERSPFLVVFDISRWALAFVFLFLVLGVIYHRGPSIRHHFYWITPGSVFCIVVWVLLGIGLRVYVQRIGALSYQ